MSDSKEVKNDVDGASCPSRCSTARKIADRLYDASYSTPATSTTSGQIRLCQLIQSYLATLVVDARHEGLERMAVIVQEHRRCLNDVIATIETVKDFGNVLKRFRR